MVGNKYSKKQGWHFKFSKIWNFKNIHVLYVMCGKSYDGCMSWICFYIYTFTMLKRLKILQ